MPERVVGICWPHEATVGHATVSTPFINGTFRSMQGSDGIVTCDLVRAGKYRNGAARSWCRIHQHYWGTKVDLAALATTAIARCARHDVPMHYVIDPLVIDIAAHASVSIALDGDMLRLQIDSKAAACHAAFAIRYETATALFPAPGIIQINVTPPMVASLASPQPQGCVCCSKCGHPHLDLGDFAMRPHKRHYCGNCGSDSTHSQAAIVSNPLLPLIDYYRTALQIPASIVQRDNML